MLLMDTDETSCVPATHQNIQTITFQPPQPDSKNEYHHHHRVLTIQLRDSTIRQRRSEGKLPKALELPAIPHKNSQSAKDRFRKNI